MLKNYIENRLKEKKILLMTHIVLGYPSFEASEQLVEKMVGAGVDLMELQIPFSEPIADGPVILSANQKALARGVKVVQCLDFAEKITKKHKIPFLFMTYYNILFRHGVEDFCSQMAKRGICGAIVPDLPPEEGDDYLEAMDKNKLSPIFIYAPTTSRERMAYLDTFAKGFIYCVARKGVTGEETDFSNDLRSYLEKCREVSHLPLAVGFGIKNKKDVDFLTGQAQIAVIGSETIRMIDEQGIEVVDPFLRSLR
ncbi:MAG: tryptophan synthase subunit alpha [Desulfobacteraceae bacterium]|nr:tryptophan synthase subunit alpha [Desulfobacteraceae bacterium]